MAGAPAYCGRNKAFIYDKGGVNLVGELPAAYSVRWQRIRDSISNCLVSVSMNECCDVLENTEPIAQELHVYRDDELVWCGPITRMEFEYDKVDIIAEDMMWVPKRRAVSTPYNYQDIPLGSGPISAIDLANGLLNDQCFAQFNDEWNMAGRLHPRPGPTNCDPRAARQTNAWSTTVWDEVDKLAEDYGMDYAVVARDIYWFDVHLNWNEIAPLVAADIADYPRLVEYGNGLATRYVRTNGSGFAGIVSADSSVAARYATAIDIVSSETQQAAPPLNGETPPVPEPPSAATLQTWHNTAERRLSQAHPVPRHVIVPANSTLMPTSPWDVNTLMPGSWFQVTVDRLCRGAVTEYNRLHELRVTETGKGGETVQFTSVPPPAFMILPTDAACDPSTGLPVVPLEEANG